MLLCFEDACCMVGKHPLNPSMSSHFLTQTIPLNAICPEKGTPCLQHLPYLLLVWVGLCAVFQRHGRIGCLNKLNLCPEVFFFSFFFVKYKNGFELLRNNNLKPIAQRKHAWLLLNTRRNPYSKDYAAGWRLKLTWWSIWINFKPSAWRVLSQNGWDKYLAEYLIWIFPSPSYVGMQAPL